MLRKEGQLLVSPQREFEWLPLLVHSPDATVVFGHCIPSWKVALCFLLQCWHGFSGYNSLSSELLV